MSTPPDALAFDRVLRALAGRCATDLGARAARDLSRAPSRDVAVQRLGRCQEAVALRREQLAPQLFERLSFDDALGRAQRGGVLDGEALRPLGALLRCAVRVHDAAPSWEPHAPTLAAEAGALPALRQLAFGLSDAFDEDDQLVDEASEDLARLRADVRRRATGLRTRIGALMKDTDDQGLLQDDYWTVRDGRYVLPVRSSDKRAIDGIIHGSSHTGQTTFVEPQEVVEANNALALAHEAVKREEHRILSMFSEAVGASADDIRRLARTLTALDLALAAAALAGDLDLRRPALSDDGRLDLRRARHPLLVLEGVDVVPNTIAIVPPARWLVVSGPNGGGKTVSLTTAGLAVEMAAHGLFVAAGDATVVPWVSSTHVVLGDAQDLDQGLSTFSGHLKRVQAALDATAARPSRAPGGRLSEPGASQSAAAVVSSDGPPALVLLDELAAGTEPSAGAALARAMLEAFADRPCLGLASTHFESVKLLALADPRFANAALTLKRDAPSYHLELNAVGSSSPMALAARMGLDRGVIERASALIGGGGAETERLLATLQDMRSQLAAELRAAERQHTLAEQARQRLDQQRLAEKRAADQRIEKQAGETLRALRDALNEARDAQRRLTDPKENVADIGRLSRKLAARQREARAAQNRVKGAPVERRGELDPTTLRPGDAVWHVGLGRAVDVVEIDLKRGEVRVTAGGLELRAKVSDLQPASAGAKKPRRRATTGVQGAHAKPQAALASADLDGPSDDHDTASFRDRTCDLRGMRVDEALHEVDRALDAAVVAGVRGVVVVHGVGTGALKSAVTQHLRKHPQVARSRGGHQGEGGAGATMVWITR